MSPVDDAYPVPCAFCNISNAYPPSPHSPIPESPDPEKLSPQCHLLLSTPHVLAFLDIMPIAPAHILVTTRHHHRTLADLRYRPTHDTSPTSSPSSPSPSSVRESARALGEWLPVVSRALCRVTGIEDWNVVQNNGERAAQVVPHVHFHLIPRYQEGRPETHRKDGRVDVGMLKSWKMFGRGAREDLDDDEGRELAKLLRDALRAEVEGWENEDESESRTGREGGDGPKSRL